MSNFTSLILTSPAVCLLAYPVWIGPVQQAVIHIESNLNLNYLHRQRRET
jgi:hypothetical protein